MASRFSIYKSKLFSNEILCSITAIEPLPTKPITTSHSAFSMKDDDLSNDTNQLFSLLTSFVSTERIIVHNQPLVNLTQTYSDKVVDYVKQCYERHSIPSLTVLIKCGLLKIHKEKSIRMTINNVTLFRFCLFYI